MRLALVTETFPPEINGVATTLGVIARELARRGHEVTVYRPRRDDLPQAVGERGYSEVGMPGMAIPGYRLLRFGFPARGALRRQWAQVRPDLVRVATEGPLGASAVSAARDLGIPVASSFHTHFHRYASDYGLGPLRCPVIAWLRRVHNRTGRTFAPTSEVARELEELRFRNLSVLSRGVDARDFAPDRRSPGLRAEWGAGPDTPVAIHVGRMAAEKNYELLFQAYAAMRAVNPRLIFVLAGDGPLKRRLLREHPDCIFAGFFSREEIGRYYASADIYIHASRTETFGNVVTEAMASGLALASFDYAAARAFVVQGVNGLVAPLDSPGALIDAAVRLAVDEALRRRLGRAAREAVEGQSWEKVIERFEAELHELVAEERQREDAAVCQ